MSAPDSGRTPAEGVLPSQDLRAAVERGWIDAGRLALPASSIQPASLDLRVGEVAYSLRCSFLPDDDRTVEEKLREFVIDEIPLSGRPALECNRPYLIPLVERLDLPPHVRGRTNPKSSTGRLDVFTRVITDGDHRFDEIAAGYRGGLYLEVVPRSFPIRIAPEISLNQLRLVTGSTRCSDDEIRAIHRETPLLFAPDGSPVADEDLRVADGLFLRVGLTSRGADVPVGYQARKSCPPIDLTRVGHHNAADYWTEVTPDGRDRVILAPEEFYLLISDEAVQIPGFLAAEMAAYDPTAGELRTHYAGFFDPGFGVVRPRPGATAVLEVRAHDVPFLLDHRQRICKLTFERMAAEPDVLYGDAIGSNYQRQDLTLSKHFTRFGASGDHQLRLTEAGSLIAPGTSPTSPAPRR